MEKVMTPKEFEEKMKEISERDDIEVRHSSGDILMAKVLISLGYEAGVEIFENMEKWYA